MDDTPKYGPKYQVVRGFKFCTMFPNVEDGLDYKAKPDDWFIVTYPKNGTTWTQQIVVLILNKGEVPDVVKESGLYSLSPFLEMDPKSVDDMVRPGAIKTHLPYSLQPKHPDAKYIVIIRNPKDVCVSSYYHQTMFPCFEYQDRSFHDFLPFWLNGEIVCGDYFDWVLSWWKHRGDPHILFLFFEDMKANPRCNILKIAEFLGDDYRNSLMDNNCEILEKVVENSSFQYMKEVINTAGAKQSSQHPNPSYRVPKEKYNFIRKGIVGDWKNHFTPEENFLMEEKIVDKLSGEPELLNIWKSYGVLTVVEQ